MKKGEKGVYEITITEKNTQIRIGYINEQGIFEYFDTVVDDEDVNGYIQCLQEFGFRQSCAHI